MRAGIRGWTLNAIDVCGKPDFVFRLHRLAVFVDGCFWHGCGTCQRTPTSNRGYWDHKIARNRRRDRKVTMALRREGWRVLRIWEHQLGAPGTAIGRIKRALAARPSKG